MTVQQQLQGLARRGGIRFALVAEEHAERAAIREYLGGMSRADAEIAAIADTADVFGVPR